MKTKPKHKTKTLKEVRLCTKVVAGNKTYGWLGTIHSEELIPFIGKKVKIRVEIVK